MITIKTLKGIGNKDICTAFVKAFADYEFSIKSHDVILQMITRRGFNPDISFGAFVNNKIVSFTINGLGIWNGNKTAYDAGTATIKEYRRQGLAKRIFQESVPVLKENGISHYLLEVVKHNDKAVNLYKNQGFEVTREFDCFVANKRDLKISDDKLKVCNIKETDFSELNLVSSYWDFIPAWQNSFESIHRTIDKFKILGAFIKNELIGYGISEIDSGDITQLAVNKNYFTIAL